MLKLDSRLVAFGAFAIFLLALALGAAPRSAQAAPPAQGGPVAPLSGSFDCMYVVRPGDTLYRIALKYGISPFTLAAVNHIGNINLIFVGMVLRVPCGGTPPGPPPPQPPPSGVCATYIVQRGDWLSRIAARYGVSVQGIAALNHLRNLNLIYPGMRLLIPCKGGGTPSRVITITQPTTNQAICTPVSVKGRTNFAPFEATLRGRVLREDGSAVGTAPIHMDVPFGQAGGFTGNIPFDNSNTGNSGFVEIAELSAKDGSVLALARVHIFFAVNPSPCQGG